MLIYCSLINSHQTGYNFLYAALFYLGLFVYLKLSSKKAQSDIDYIQRNGAAPSSKDNDANIYEFLPTDERKLIFFYILILYYITNRAIASTDIKDYLIYLT